MKAIVQTVYGSPDVMALQEVEKPTINDDQVLVKVHAASANPLDWHFMRGTPYFMRMVSGLIRPKNTILGADTAGTVEAIGPDVTRFKVGDEVFGSASHGGFAEYNAMPERTLVHKPDNITFDEAAAVPVAALTALQGLRDQGKLEAGQHVLINGASGGVGSYAVQIAKLLGATVTGVCSTRNVELVQSLGADHVIDYKKDNFTRSNTQYDLLLDNAANHKAADFMAAIKPGGTWVLIGFSMRLMIAAGMFGKRIEKRHGKNVQMFTARIIQEDLSQLAEWLKSEQLKSVIDRQYPLAETPEAIRYLETGRAKAKVIIDVTA
ncbi:MAG: NAD(P)-dependent alcohol dehydrogenase [Chloroflexota bacterium]